MKILLVMPLILMMTVTCTDEEHSAESPTGRTLDYPATVSFINSSGEVTSVISAAVADDNVSRAEGLMEVFDLPMENGMLFIFEDEQPRSFWMANTPLALDLIFVNADLEIVRIHRNTQPYSDRNIQSEVPAMYVIETNAGYTIRNDITEGMTVEFELDQI